MGNCLSKFNDKPFTLHTPPLTSGHLKRWQVVYKITLHSILPRAYITNMDMKHLHKVLKVVL